MLAKYSSTFVNSALQGKLKDLNSEELEKPDIDFGSLAPRIEQVATELGSFDELIRIVSDDELKAIDEFAADHNSFTVFANLSIGVRVGPRTLAEGRTNSEDNYSRRGLAWVMALARFNPARSWPRSGPCPTHSRR